MECYCDKPVRHTNVVLNTKNHGRPYHRCHYIKKQCGFFEWCKCVTSKPKPRRVLPEWCPNVAEKPVPELVSDPKPVVAAKAKFSTLVLKDAFPSAKECCHWPIIKPGCISCDRKAYDLGIARERMEARKAQEDITAREAIRKKIYDEEADKIWNMIKDRISPLAIRREFRD